MKELFSHHPGEQVKGVAIVARRRSGILLARAGRQLDLIRGLVEPGEDDGAAALRIMQERSAMTFDPVRFPASLTDMGGSHPVQYQLIEATNLTGEISSDDEEGLGFYSERRIHAMFAAGVGATAVLGAFLWARLAKTQKPDV